MSSPLSATVQRLEGETVVLATSDGQTLRLPRTAVEGVVTEDTTVLLLAVSHGSDASGRNTMARHLVNEILGTKLPPTP